MTKLPKPQGAQPDADPTIPADGAPLQFIAEVKPDIQAASGKPPRFEGLAYAGGAIRVPGYAFPVVVDLAGLSISNPVKMLANHDTKTDGVVGVGNAEVRGGNLYVSGNLGGVQSDQIVRMRKDGLGPELSLGAQPVKQRFYKQGETFTANGRTHAGPAWHIQESRLVEISFVGVGADPNTAVSIAARRSVQHMDEQTIDAAISATVDPVQSGRQYIADIERVTHGPPDITAQALRENWTVQKASDTAELKTIRASMPRGGQFIHGATTSHGVEGPKVIEAAFLIHMGKESLAEQTLGAQVCEAAKSIRARHLGDIIEYGCTMDHIPLRSRDTTAMIRAGFEASTLSLPYALGNVANKLLLEGFMQTAATWRLISRVIDLKNFFQHKPLRGYLSGGLSKVASNGELKYATVGELDYTVQAGTQGVIVGISRQDIINDELGMFADLSSTLGQEAGRKLADDFYTALHTGVSASYFTSGNGNYVSGGGTDLALDSLAEAVQAMRKKTDPDGRTLDMQPATLLVPPELEVEAKAITSPTVVVAGDTDIVRGSNNPLAQAIGQVVVEPRLSNTSISGYSTSAWYLFSKPTDGAMLVGFLNGKQAPTTEFFGLDQDVNKLGVSWRVYHDWAVALGEHRAAYKSAGA